MRFNNIFRHLIFVLCIVTYSPSFSNSEPSKFQQIDDKKYSDKELENFLNAYRAIIEISRELNITMVETVKEEGFTIERFSEIQKALKDHNTYFSISDKELNRHKILLKKLDRVQMNSKKLMERRIISENLSLKKYERLLADLQRDENLQMRLKRIIKK